MNSLSFLQYLAGVTARSFGLAALAAIAMLVFRVKSAALRHAVWTLVVAGMLVLAAGEAVLPSLPLPVLRANPASARQLLPPLPEASSATRARSAPVPTVARPVPGWPRVAVAVYAAGLLALLVRLAFSYLFTRRLVRASHPIDRTIDRPADTPLYESSWISVPLTVGCLRPRILLPAGWDQWPAEKLQAVLTHEQTHVERADWAIAVLAGVNRCLFWFHPLAWWLERRLALLAEQACDDSALRLVATEPYAQALLDMAAAVKAGHGRLVWGAMAMANVAEVRKRIERILDETRQIPEGLTWSRWATLIACSLPLIYFTTVVRPVAAQAPPSIQELLAGKRQLAAADAGPMEQYLAANPNDLEARSQLIAYYFTAGARDRRLAHTYWLIANHPESSAAATTSKWISPTATAFNDATDYARAAGLWKQQAAARPTETRVLGNAADFLAQPGGDLNEAERLLIGARGIEPQNLTFRNRLAKLYADAVAGKFDAAFADHVKLQLENSTDGMLLGWTGRMMVDSRVPPAVDMGKQLIAHGEQYGFPPAPIAKSIPSTVGTPPTPPAPTLASAPTLIDKVEPVYPPLAKQARIQGFVRLNLTVEGDGKVQHIQVVMGHPLLVPAALEAVKQWVYSPVPGGGTFQVDVPFTLPPREVTSSDGFARVWPKPEGVTGGVQGGVIGGVINGVPGGAAGSRFRVVQQSEIAQAAKLISKVEPEYPALARQAGIAGSVVLEVTIGEDGKVLNVRNRDGHPLLTAAAMAAVRQWVYSPTLIDNQAAVVMTTVTVNFQ